MQDFTYRTDLYWSIDSYCGVFVDDYDIDGAVAYIMRNYSDNPDTISYEALESFNFDDAMVMFDTTVSTDVDVDIQFDYDKGDWHIWIDDPASDNIYFNIGYCDYEQACRYYNGVFNRKEA